MSTVGGKKRRRYRLHGARTLVTREIAALDFLQKIPMACEEEICLKGLVNTSEDIKGEDHQHSDEEDEVDAEQEVHPPGFWSGMRCALHRFLPTFSNWSDRSREANLMSHTENTGVATEGESDEEKDRNLLGAATAQPLLNPKNDDRPENLFGGAFDAGLGTGTKRDVFGTAIARAARNTQSQVTGIMLIGPASPVVAIPDDIRYRLSREGNAKVRQWEQDMVQRQGMERNRLFFSCNHGYPISVSSVIRYDPGEEEKRRRREKLAEKLQDQRAASAFRIVNRDWRGTSFADLLPAARARKQLARFSAPFNGGSLRNGIISNTRSDGLAVMESGNDVVKFDDDDEYEPGVIDDPNMSQGKYCQVIRGDDALGPIVCSVLKFAKSKDLKDELNHEWRERHPDMPSSLSLSKIRNLKTEALNGCCKNWKAESLHGYNDEGKEDSCEVVTVAYACIYFERLCLQRIVTKANRRLSMATCLILAYKFNEPLHIGGRDPRMKRLLDFIDEEWSISPDQVHEAEFGLLVRLKFRLHCNPEHVAYHFQRLVKTGLHQSVREYLHDDAMFHDWVETPQWQAQNAPTAACADGLSALRQAYMKQKGNTSVKAFHSSINLAIDAENSTTGAQLSTNSRSGQQWWRRRRATQQPLQAESGGYYIEGTNSVPSQTPDFTNYEAKDETNGEDDDDNIDSDGSGIYATPSQ